MNIEQDINIQFNIMQNDQQSLVNSPLQHFLKKHKAKGGIFNFTNLAHPFGSFFVPDEKKDDLYEAYIETIKKSIVPPLTEKPGKVSVVTIDVDLRFDENCKERRYTTDTVDAIVRSYYDTFVEFVGMNDDNDKCYVFERPAASAPFIEVKKNGTIIVKDGFHMMFPFISCGPALKYHARLKAIDDCEDTFKSIGAINKTSDIIDLAIIERNNWFVYGSGKTGREPYKLTTIYDRHMNSIPFEESHDLVKLLSVSERPENVTYIKPIPVAVKNAPESSTVINKKDQLKDTSINSRMMGEEVSLDLLQSVVMGLKNYRAAGFLDWSEVVWAIINISHLNNYPRKGRELVHDFSSKEPDFYDESRVEDFLNTNKAREKGKNFGTLVNCLKEDNKKLHEELLGPRRDYDSVKSRFELNHFKLIDPPGFLRHDENGLFPKSKKDLYDNYENLFFNENKDGVVKKHAFIKKWLCDEDIRTFRRLDFLPPPQVCPSNVYNLFTGFPAENANDTTDDVDLSLLFDLHSKLCGNDDRVIKYSFSFLASLVQNPGDLPRVAILWLSSEGVGKNLFLDFIGNKIIGPQYYFSTSNVEDLFGTFAVGLKHKLLVNFNEVRAVDTKKYLERIKSTITDECITYQAKNVMTISLHNFAHFVFTSNNRNSLSIGTSDRRLVAVECDSSHRKNYRYFEEVAEMMNRNEVISAFYKFLKQYDISEWRPSRRPFTNYYRELQEANVPIMSRWLIDIIDHDDDIDHVKPHVLMSRYLDWLNERNYKSEIPFVNEKSFGRDIKKYGGVIYGRSSDARGYSFRNDELSRWLIDNNHLIGDDHCVFLDD